MAVTVSSHFEKSTPDVKATYTAITKAARALGPMREEPKKTSIHLVRTSAFAGVAVRKESLILTLKAAKPINSRRVHKSEQVSANRWHCEVRLSSVADVNADLKAWIAQAYELA